MAGYPGRNYGTEGKEMNCVRVHPIGYENRPHGHHPDLFKALAPFLAGRRHAMIEDINQADAILFDSNVWDVSPKGDNTMYSPYNWEVLNVVLKKRLLVVFFDNFDYYGTATYACPWAGKNDWGDMLNIQHQDWAKFMYAASRPGCCSILYFMRKMQDKGQSYPPWVVPLEYPLFNHYLMASREELFARPNDVCLLANASLPRMHAMRDLLADNRLKVDAAMMPVRIPHEAWVERHRQAKLFVEADASMGSERPQRLMMVAPMLRVKSDHRLPFPRQDMVHQVEVGDYDGNISKEDVDKILSVTKNPELLYNIYVNGVNHMLKHYSIEARCNYVIDHIERVLSK